MSTFMKVIGSAMFSESMVRVGTGLPVFPA